MCGISGFNWRDAKLVKLMNDSLKHRGPDGEGVFLDKNLSLGHRRLAVIDLSKKALQPMKYSHKGKKAVIVHNGEIYNFQKLKKELEKRGYKFKTKTDTEVILASYLEEGFDCIKRFNGMWAFCIYDPQKEILFLSRDRLGQKPLYYFYDGKRFIFSSEIKGILQHKIKHSLDKEGVDLYFSLGFIPAPKTIYSEINKLEAGHNLILNLKTKKLQKKKYFYLKEYSPINNKKSLIGEGKELLKDATKIRLIADVPIGAFLSGGVDSSSVVSEITNILGKESLTTYSMGFEKEYDETKYIKTIIKKFKVNNHHFYFTKKELKEILKSIFYYFDEPLSDPSIFPAFLLSKFARKSLTVALSGDGGDEMFGGYPRYKIGIRIETLKKIPARLRKLICFLIPETKKFSKIREGIKLSLLQKEILYSEAREDVYKPHSYKRFVEEKFKECLKISHGDLVEAMRVMDILYLTLSDNYLAKVDRTSMANSLEVRSPFLDYRFLDFSLKIPKKWKVSLFNEKILLKEVVKRDIPKRVLKRKKQGFTPPLEKWLIEKKGKEELKKILKKIEKERIIDNQWIKFYKKRVIKEKDQISKTYSVRLFVFYKWLEFWQKPEN